MMTYMMSWVMFTITVMMIIRSDNQRVIQMPGIMMVMMIMMINSRVVGYPLVAMIIMYVGIMMVDIMMIPE